MPDGLEMAVAAGFAPADALAAATRAAARFMRAADWGTIEPGKIADLVMLDADPLERIANTRSIAGVMLRGNWLSADARQALLARLR